MNDGDDGAIVIVGNRPAVQPRVQRRVSLGHRHEQPERQRQHRRRRVQTLAQMAVIEIYELQIVCNIFSTAPDASGL